MSSSDDDRNRAARVIALYWSEMLSATVIVSLRMYSRRMARTTGLDDWLMLGGLIMHLTLSGFTTYYAVEGGYRHLDSLSETQRVEVLKWSYILQFWIILAFIPPRMSVAILITRIMKPLRGWRYWTLVVSIAVMIVLNVLDAILTYIQCDPVEALWDRRIKTAHCWKPSIQPDFSKAQASFSVYVDVLLAVIPATLVYRLNIAIRRRVGLIILLGLGLSAGAAAGVKTWYLAGLSQRSDLTWYSYNLNVWAGTENWLVIVCGSIPLLKPLWDEAVARCRRTEMPPLSRSTGLAPTGSDLLVKPDPRHGNLRESSDSVSLISLPGRAVGEPSPAQSIA